ncbi:MAG: hypothetical protein JSV03_13600, partial [Planctomycetota bacterium]
MTVQNHLYRITWTPVLLVIMSAVSAADTDARSNTLPTAGYIDEAVFREGLRQRGLTDLLEQYFQDNPPLNKIDAQMRQREELLEKASQQIIPNHQRESIIDKASDILSKLIEKHPNHPARLRWRYELARDILERKDPTIFDILLLYELPGRDRVKAGKLSRRAIEVLNHLRQQTDAIWQAAEALDETALEQVTVSGALQSVEAIDMQSAFLLSWARLYHALSLEPAEAQPSAVWSDLLAQVTEKYGWIKLPAGRETQQCSALIIAATAARRLGQFNEANDYARQIITSLAQVDNPETRKQLSRASLTAVLEQIRILRDRNRQDDAQKAIKQAHHWAKRTRPDDIQTDLALALTEHSLLTGKLPTATKPTETNHIETFILHHHSLAPLKQLANKSPSHRDALYSILAGALETEPLNISRTTFALQLIVGAAVMDARINRSAPHSTIDKRLNEVIDALENTSYEVSPDTLFSIAELSYLSAQAYYLAGRHLTAVNKLLSYV